MSFIQIKTRATANTWLVDLLSEFGPVPRQFLTASTNTMEPSAEKM